jgi:HD-like signal output (HDOD) protein
MPHTLAQAIAMVRNSKTITVEQVTRVVERDPLVVARLLKSVNSAYYGMQRRVSSVEHAVILRGPFAVAGYVIALGMIRTNAVLGGPAGPFFARLIRQSVATACIARTLESLTASCSGRSSGVPAKSPRSSSAYTAGLLHNFGRIVLVYNFPEAAAKLYAEGHFSTDAEPGAIREMERTTLGCDHLTANEFAAMKLDFPDELARAIVNYHAPEHLEGSRRAVRLARLVSVAHLASAAMGYGFPSACSREAFCTHPNVMLYLRTELSSLLTPDQLLMLLLKNSEAIRHEVDSISLDGAARAA